MSQEFTLSQNNDYVAVKGSYAGELVRILVLNGSIFNGAKLEIFVGQLYNDEFDFNQKVIKEETEITESTGFDYTAFEKDKISMYAILKLTNVTTTASVNIVIGTSTKQNIKFFIQ